MLYRIIHLTCESSNSQGNVEAVTPRVIVSVTVHEGLTGYLLESRRSFLSGGMSGRVTSTSHSAGRGS